MLLDVALQTLETVRQVLNIRPRPICLCTLNFLSHLGLVGKVGIVKVAVIAKEEGREVQRKVTIFLLLCVDY